VVPILAAMLLVAAMTPAPAPAIDPLVVGEPVRNPAVATDPLVAAVRAALPARPESTGTRVAVLREDRGRAGSGGGTAGWAFGIAVELAPAEPHAYPYGWLWLAHHDDPGDGEGPSSDEARMWSVALEGSARFTALSRRAPVLRAPERATLGTGQESAVPDYRTGMRLPYAHDQAWSYTGGPHPMSGAARSSIDLAGGDGRVRAAAAGLAYRMCPGWVRVIHDHGFATDYYHLHGAIEADGRRVEDGEYLGDIGTEVSCGGSVTGPHVHFSLRRDGDYVDIDGYGFGMWTVRAGAESYEGSAWHGSQHVEVGGALRNYGALQPTEGVVDTDGGGVLNRRAGPGTGYEVVGTVEDGATVGVECSAPGTTHTGRDGYTSDLWDRLDDGSWVSDVFLWTGSDAPEAGWCSG
jgi:LasA protease